MCLGRSASVGLNAQRPQISTYLDMFGLDSEELCISEYLHTEDGSELIDEGLERYAWHEQIELSAQPNYRTGSHAPR